MRVEGKAVLDGVADNAMPVLHRLLRDQDGRFSAVSFLEDFDERHPGSVDRRVQAEVIDKQYFVLHYLGEMLQVGA